MSDSDPIADRLADVVDDEAADSKALTWAEERWLAGDDPDAMAAQLINQGWDPNRAEPVVEAARQNTRAERGVVTHADIRRKVDRLYNRAMSSPFLAFMGINALRKLLHALASLRLLNRLKR
ncbi:MAG TPA: hypothetical protein VGB55_02030 [Tepidisphaeraceae bacterium]|jgi:hypothetical protein